MIHLVPVCLDRTTTSNAQRRVLSHSRASGMSKIFFFTILLQSLTCQPQRLRADETGGELSVCGWFEVHYLCRLLAAPLRKFTAARLR